MMRQAACGPDGSGRAVQPTTPPNHRPTAPQRRYGGSEPSFPGASVSSTQSWPAAALHPTYPPHALSLQSSQGRKPRLFAGSSSVSIWQQQRSLGWVHGPYEEGTRSGPALPRVAVLALRCGTRCPRTKAGGSQPLERAWLWASCLQPQSRGCAQSTANPWRAAEGPGRLSLPQWPGLFRGCAAAPLPITG